MRVRIGMMKGIDITRLILILRIIAGKLQIKIAQERA